MRSFLFARFLSSSTLLKSMSKVKTNKFINDAETVVDDSIRGLLHAYPSCAVVDSCHRVVVRSDIEEVRKAKRVTLLAGGGSGHEPYAAGFVGKGLISAAVCGNVFASPPTAHISTALSAITSSSGTAVYIINYTGDRLNFGLAVERFNGSKRDEDGIAEAVLIGDDVALEKSEAGGGVGRRGLAGAVLLLKIAGAMAEDCSDLQTIVFTSRTVNENMGTFGVSLSACSIPGKGPMFELGENQMEFGLGIHGEAGCERSDYRSAKDVAKLLVEKLESSKKLKLHKGERIAVLLNNLGGTSQLELNVLAGEILSELFEKGYDVERFYADAVMTSLDGHGISVTILKLIDDDWLRYLDMETEAPAWKFTHQLQKRPKHLKEIKCSQIEKDVDARTGTTLSESEAETVKGAIRNACTAVINATEELNKLDGGAGDGDCGSTLKHGAEMLLQKLDKGKLCCDRPQTLFQQISQVFEDDVGGTAGALYALMFSTAAQSFTDSATPKEWYLALRNGLQAIMTYGRAKPGHRSMVDPLNAAVSAVCDSHPTKSHWEMAVQKAAEAAQATSTMRAQVGRASYTAAAAQHEPDAGATAVAIWLRAAYENVYKLK